MQSNWEKVVRRMSEGEAPAGLGARIVLAIARESIRQARMRLALFGGVALASFGALVPVLRYAFESASGSGFSDYFSLVFSDAPAVLASWREFLLLLAESLPVASILAALAALFVFLVSCVLAAQYAKPAFRGV